MIKENQTFKASIIKGAKSLKYGYTTGSCATAAAKAAAYQLLTGESIDTVHLHTPKGFELDLVVQTHQQTATAIQCSIVKDAGDDPDVTHGITIYARVTKVDKPGICIEGGEGIGRVTKPGLKIEVGQAAINPGPRQTIHYELQKLCDKYQYTKGLAVLIEAPEGVEIAKKTFNPRLGIVGGISILGTTGIVEPMSEKAIIDTIYTEIDMMKAAGFKHLLVCPGNYGLNFMTQQLQLEGTKAIKCSNFIGETLDYASYLGFESMLLVGHVGKLIKLAAGIMNTHSKYADGRMEIICAHAAKLGATQDVLQQLWEAVTTDEAIKCLETVGLVGPVMESIMLKIQEHVDYRVRGKLKVQVIVFSDVYGYLGDFKDREEVMTQIKEAYQQ